MKMKLLFAPMEGLTGYTYRNLHHTCFGGVDAYYTPFISAGQDFKFQNKERADYSPLNNKTIIDDGIQVIPQVMTNNAEAFCWAVMKLSESGYREVNLNLGCPSATVVSRGKGAGFLRNTDALDLFFEEAFDGLSKAGNTDTSITVKTRIGVSDPSEAGDIIRVYNRYPISGVIIHPRVMKQAYEGTPDIDCFAACLEESRHPVCYNGDIRTAADYEWISKKFGDRIYAVMMGRGLIADPALAREIRGGERLGRGALMAYTDKLYAGYKELFGSDVNVLHKMKEIWTYEGRSFEGSEPYVHRILVSKRVDDYENSVRRLFDECGIKAPGEHSDAWKYDIYR